MAPVSTVSTSHSMPSYLHPAPQILIYLHVFADAECLPLQANAFTHKAGTLSAYNVLSMLLSSASSKGTEKIQKCEGMQFFAFTVAQCCEHT